MIFLLSFLSILSFWQLPLFFAPLYLFLYIYLFKKNWLVPALLLFSLSYDLFWVLPFGLSGLFISLFLVVVSLYKQKYNVLNQFFLFTMLVLSSGLVLRFFNLTLVSLQIFIFSLLFLLLSLKLKNIRKDSLLSI